MANSLLEVSIITPEGTIFTSVQAELVIAKSTLGEITLLSKHAPIFTKLEHGELRVRVGGRDTSFTIYDGFLNMTPDNTITVLADTARRSEELNISAIRRAKEAAERALSNKEKLSATEILRAETAMRRAIMELRVAEKRNRLN